MTVLIHVGTCNIQTSAQTVSYVQQSKTCTVSIKQRSRGCAPSDPEQRSLREDNDMKIKKKSFMTCTVDQVSKVVCLPFYFTVLLDWQRISSSVDLNDIILSLFNCNRCV